jgi:hypothetical protein
MFSRRAWKVSAVTLGAVALIVAGGGSALGGSLRVGTAPDYPPWEYTDESGQLTGFEVELVNELATLAGYDGVEWSTVDFSDLLPDLIDGRFDVAAGGLDITAGRLVRVNFTRPYPLFGGLYGLAVRKEDAGLSAALDSALSQLAESGRYSQLYEQYFGPLAVFVPGDPYAVGGRRIDLLVPVTRIYTGDSHFVRHDWNVENSLVPAGMEIDDYIEAYLSFDLDIDGQPVSTGCSTSFAYDEGLGWVWTCHWLAHFSMFPEPYFTPGEYFFHGHWCSTAPGQEQAFDRYALVIASGDPLVQRIGFTSDTVRINGEEPSFVEEGWIVPPSDIPSGEDPEAHLLTNYVFTLEVDGTPVPTNPSIGSISPPQGPAAGPKFWSVVWQTTFPGGFFSEKDHRLHGCWRDPTVVQQDDVTVEVEYP